MSLDRTSWARGSFGRAAGECRQHVVAKCPRLCLVVTSLDC